MCELDTDIFYSNSVIYNSGVPDNYGKIYPLSNDSLNLIFSEIDLQDKDVLSVVGSSDQIFHFYNNGAKNVDMFDINKLTLFYYFIRVWTIKYMNMFYPVFDSFSISYDFLKQLLSVIKPESLEEKNAYNYWIRVLNTFDKSEIPGLFYSDYVMENNKIDDVSKVRDVLEGKSIKFYNIDITDQVDIDKNYDMIYLSNITEWAFIHDWNIERYRDNLSKLLKKGGKLICTKYNCSAPSNAERRIFEKNFSYNSFSKHHDDTIGDWIAGYVYTKI